MISSIAYLILAAGVPYYVLLESFMKIKSKYIFLISAFLLLCASLMTFYVPNEHEGIFPIIALFSSVYSIYKATSTTNFYKLGYYFIFINSPLFILFGNQGATYALSLLTSLAGIYLIARFYEKNYGSANYHYITGVTLIRPYIATFLTLYLIAIALYPPFPNSLFFLNAIFKSDPSSLLYLVVIILFFGNFYLAMKVMSKTLFGRPNENIHYVHMTSQEKITHFMIIAIMLVLSIIGLKETFS